MRVGVNYPWRDYGWDFGVAPPAWRAAQAPPRWLAQIDEHLAHFQSLGISVVRRFIFADGLTYGSGAHAPRPDPSGGGWRFDPRHSIGTPCRARLTGTWHNGADVAADRTAADARNRERRMQVRLYRTTAEHDRDDSRYWAEIPVAERILEVWRLSEELWRLRGEFPDEPGLRRSPARLHRR